MRPEHQLLHGPALSAVLKLLESGPQTGFQLALKLRSACPEALALGEASLYGLLHDLEAHRLAAASWQPADGGRRRLYALTPRGQQRLAEECRQWKALVSLFEADDHRVQTTGSETGGVS